MGRRRAFVRNIKRASRRGVPFMGLALAATSAWAPDAARRSTR